MIFRSERFRIPAARTLLGGLIFFAAAAASSATPPGVPAPKPAAASFSPGEGHAVVEIKFDKDGKVENCRILRSNAPYALEVSTLDFIKGHWIQPLFAGETLNFPITYAAPMTSSPYWDDEMIPPPDFLSVGDPDRELKLRLTFGSDGWISKLEIVDSSGSDTVDRQTELWVKVHWHHDAYANMVMDAPFQFKAPQPAPPPPPVVSAPLKPSPATPPPEPEPVAIPAVRVQ